MKILNTFYLGIVLGLAGCATVPITGRKQLSVVPVSQLASMSTDNYRSFLKEAKLSDDQTSVAMVQRVGQSIVEATTDYLTEINALDRIKGFEWEFNLVVDETANAFAMPGGKVVVNTGILPITRNEAGLAAVLGHEIAHVLANHGGERMSQLLLVNLGGFTLSQALKQKPAQTQQLWMTAFGLGTTFGAVLPYSRLHENEADRIGLILMAKAGYDPREAIGLWERMNANAKTRVPEFLSTHPAPATRIDRLNAAMEEAMSYYQP